MSKRKSKISLKNSLSASQQTISKFFHTKSESLSFRKRSGDSTENDHNNSLSNKIPRLLSTTNESHLHEKCQLHESTIARLQSYSSKCNTGTKSPPKLVLEKHPCETESKSSFKESSCTEIVTVEEPRNLKKKKSESSDSSVKYTPLEKQYIEFKHKYPDAILLIECGYKFRFFGEDAEIASKVLNIACFMCHNFMSAIIPTQRMHYHVRKLVLKGYKVGVVKQTETAALKADGGKKNELFSRELSALYTKATLIGEEFQMSACGESSDNNEVYDPDLNSNCLVCVSEVPLKNKKGYSIGILGVQLTSGRLLYSSFDDDLALRNKLESSLHLLSPSEILIPSCLSKETESLINGYSFERSTRIEKFPLIDYDYSKSLEKVSKFYAEENSSEDTSPEMENTLQTILAFPPIIVCCLSALIDYLTKFQLQKILKNLRNMEHMSTSESMILTAATLKGLEILKNNSNHSEYGSLFWVLNKTETKFGERLLKSWISKPLKDLEKIEERLNIVTEILHSQSMVFKVIEKVLLKLPDLEKALCSIFYQKCSCYDFFKLVEALSKIRTELVAVTDKIQVEVQISRIKTILLDIPYLLSDVERYMLNIDPEAAKNGDKTKVFQDVSMFPELQECKNSISILEKKLNDLKPEICKILRLFDMKYSSVAGQKYLIEVPNSNLRLVPKEWLKISGTKHVSRFRSPEIVKYCKEIDKQNELMIIYANEAWSNYLNEFGKSFYKHKRAILHLAELDCYFSFAKVSKEEEFCRPCIIDDAERIFSIVQGRHPVVTKMIDGKQFVANDVSMNSTNGCVIVTGPNMGGKSTYVRQTALVALMAHMGCYVPAESATIPLFDNIYVRMGADDDLANRKSTFMVEMCEASQILNNATSKSFAVLDELGRGTSTNDGTAVAYAALEYLISNIKCHTLFVTHYPEIIELKDHFPDNVSTVTMAYILKDKNDESDIETVTFLYNVINGISEQSYGINVAALTGIPNSILRKAHDISQNRRMKTEIMRKIKSLALKIQASTEATTVLLS